MPFWCWDDGRRVSTKWLWESVDLTTSGLQWLLLLKRNSGILLLLFLKQIAEYRSWHLCDLDFFLYIFRPTNYLNLSKPSVNALSCSCLNFFPVHPNFLPEMLKSAIHFFHTYYSHLNCNLVYFATTCWKLSLLQSSIPSCY